MRSSRFIVLPGFLVALVAFGCAGAHRAGSTDAAPMDPRELSAAARHLRTVLIEQGFSPEEATRRAAVAVLTSEGDAPIRPPRLRASTPPARAGRRPVLTGAGLALHVTPGRFAAPTVDEITCRSLVTRVPGGQATTVSIFATGAPDARSAAFGVAYDAEMNLVMWAAPRGASERNSYGWPHSGGAVEVSAGSVARRPGATLVYLGSLVFDGASSGRLRLTGHPDYANEVILTVPLHAGMYRLARRCVDTTVRIGAELPAEVVYAPSHCGCPY